MWVFKLNAGNAKMQEIAKAIQEGASAYMNRQYKTVAVVAAALFVVLWGAGAVSDKFGLLTAIGFLVGAGASSIAGYVGMIIAVRANVRTAQAAHNGMNAALTVAFRGGAVTGLLLIGLGLLAISGLPILSSFGRGALQESSSTGVNAFAMFDHCTRYNAMVSHTGQFERKLTNALMKAHHTPGGPVHLAIPLDILRDAAPSAAPT